MTRFGPMSCANWAPRHDVQNGPDVRAIWSGCQTIQAAKINDAAVQRFVCDWDQRKPLRTLHVDRLTQAPASAC